MAGEGLITEALERSIWKRMWSSLVGSLLLAPKDPVVTRELWLTNHARSRIAAPLLAGLGLGYLVLGSIAPGLWDAYPDPRLVAGMMAVFVLAAALTSLGLHLQRPDHASPGRVGSRAIIIGFLTFAAVWAGLMASLGQSGGRGGAVFIVFVYFAAAILYLPGWLAAAIYGLGLLVYLAAPPYSQTGAAQAVTINTIVLAALAWSISRLLFLSRVRSLAARDEIVRTNAELDREVAERKRIEQRRAERITSALYTIARGVHLTAGLEEFYRLVHASLAEVFDVDNFFIALYDKDENVIRFPYFVDELDEKPAPIDVGESGPLLGEVIRTGRTILFKEDGESNRPAFGGDGERGGVPARSWLGAPLRVRGEVIGALVVRSYTDPQSFDGGDAELLESIAHQLAVALERKRDEDALRESERRYRQLFTHMLSGWALHKIITDDSGRPVDYEFLEVNSAFEQITGLKGEEVIGRRATEIFPRIKDDDFDWIGVYGRVALEGGSIRFERRSPSSNRWLAVSVYSPTAGYFAAVFDDVSERRRAEEALRESHQRLVSILDGIQADICVIDFETREILFVNQHMKDSFGRDLVGKVCWTVFNHGVGPCPHCTNDLLVTPEGEPAGVVVWESKNDITGSWYRNQDQAIRWVDGRLVKLEVSTNIDDLKKAEEETLKAERLKGALETAGAACHELNQPLQVITGQLELALMDLPEGSPIRDRVASALAETERMGRITRQLNSLTGHETRDYLDGQRILDLDRSSEDD